MEVTQLSTIIQDCRQMLRMAQNNIQQQAKDIKIEKTLTQLIRKRKVQITQLHHEVKHQRFHQIQMKNKIKMQIDLKKQIVNTKAIQLKSQEQQKRITQLYKALSLKITDLNSNIRKKQHQQNLFLDEANRLQQIQNSQVDYQMGLRKIQKNSQKAIQLYEQQNALLHQKLLKIADVQNYIDDIDHKTQQLQMKITLQNQIITSIRTKQIQIQQKCQPIVDQDHNFIFYRKNPLDLWQLNQVQQLADRRQHASLKQQRQIAKIIKFKQRTQPPIQYANTNTYRNYSKDEIQSFPKQFKKFKSHPLRQLTQRKSLPIATRIDIKKPSENKRIGIDLNNSNSMGQVYPLFPKHQKLINGATSLNNIEVFKLKRSQNRKRKKMGLKGVVLERDSFQ